MLEQYLTVWYVEDVKLNLFLTGTLSQSVIDDAPPETPHKGEYQTGATGGEGYFYPQKPVYYRFSKSPLIYYLKPWWKLQDNIFKQKTMFKEVNVL